MQQLDAKYTQLESGIQQQSLKLLKRLLRKEAKLQQAVEGKDSATAQRLFAGVDAQYLTLQHKLQSPINPKSADALKEYLPGVDSMQTALNFLGKSNNPLNTVLPAEKLSQIQGVRNALQQLQGRLQQANELKQFISEREQLLKEQLGKMGLGKQLLGMNKEVYYYQQQLQDYKNLLHNPKALEQKALAVVRSLPAFQQFWQKNSYLAQLFPMPENYGSAAALAGLQTRTDVQAIISQRMGGLQATGSPEQMMQQQIQQAQGEINQLKDKLNKLGGGNSDMTMPDFKPNSQHNKSFWNRLEYGFNVQSQQGTGFIPATTDFALSAGYRLNDQISAGIGGSYRMGWGNGWNHIKISSEGVSMRSYVDMQIARSASSDVRKLFGDLWITGGLEYNYMQSFKKLQDLHSHMKAWQKSALVGLTKKYKMGKKECKLQLLYDFLAAKQLPTVPSLKFRIGYSF